MASYKLNRDPQSAADLIASLDGIDRDNAMDAASAVGFVPEFYVNSIRVHLPQ
jgi:hypothetical protein